MGRHRRIDFPGACHLVTLRMAGETPPFSLEPANAALTDAMSRLLPRYRQRCHGYVFLGHEAHLLLESMEGGLSLAMAGLTRSLSRFLSGSPDMQTDAPMRPAHRFRSILFEKNRFLLPLNRYLCFLPVRRRAVRWADEYPWSSFRALAGLEPCPTFLYPHDVLRRFGQDRSTARDGYAEYVEAGYNAPPPFSEARQPAVLGGPEFTRHYQAVLAGRIPMPRQERPVPEKPCARPSLSRIFRADRTPGPRRDRAIHRACLEHGHSRRSVAAYLGVHPSTVGRILKRSPDRT